VVSDWRLALRREGIRYRLTTDLPFSLAPRALVQPRPRVIGSASAARRSWRSFCTSSRVASPLSFSLPSATSTGHRTPTPPQAGAWLLLAFDPACLAVIWRRRADGRAGRLLLRPGGVVVRSTIPPAGAVRRDIAVALLRGAARDVLAKATPDARLALTAEALPAAARRRG
jgi:hypothetical protein